MDLVGRHFLVAGGAGFLGSHLVDRLLVEGSRVTVFDSLVTGQRDNLQDHASLEFHHLDIISLDVESWAQKLGRLDGVFNLASPASPVDFSRIPDLILQTATHGHRQLLELAKRAGCRILFASSSEVYGDAEVHPQPESYFGNVNSFGHRSCYDEAKRVGEALSLAWKLEHGVSIRIARIFNTYGPRMRLDDGRIIPNFAVQALQREPLTVYGDGQQTRSFTFVKDEVDGLLRLFQSDLDRPVNIGSTFEHTVAEVAALVNELTGNPAGIRNLPLPPNDPKQRRPDISLAKAALGWSPQTGFRGGLKETIAEFQARLARRGEPLKTKTVSSG